jgi:hypothetical protein
MFDKLPVEVKIVEVGPRDGLQNEAEHVPTDKKIALIEALGKTGLPQIEITSFVSPKWIPQMADAAEVAAKVRLPANVRTSALVPNLKGLESAKASGMKEIAVFMSATESHSKKNINKSIDEAVETLSEVVQAAKAEGMRVRGYLSVVFACPYEGKTNPTEVVRLTALPLRIESRSCSGSFPVTKRNRRSLCTSTTPAVPRWRMCLQDWMPASPYMMPASAAWVDAPTHREPQGIWLLKTLCICSMKWASKPASISTSW